MWALLALIALPIVEIALFIQVGSWIGLWPTIALVLLAAAAGIALLRQNGPRTLGSVQNAMRRGEDPGEQIFGASMVLVAAMLLITPGFLTDIFAIILLIPPLRGLLYQAVRKRLELRATTIVSSYSHTQNASRVGDIVIEGDFEDVSPQGPADNRPSQPPSGWTQH